MLVPWDKFIHDGCSFMLKYEKRKIVYKKNLNPQPGEQCCVTCDNEVLCIKSYQVVEQNSLMKKSADYVAALNPGDPWSHCFFMDG